MSNWTFITNHGAVLAMVADRGQITSREIAATLGITERTVLRIIGDLEDGEYLRRYKDGRQNYYKVDTEQPLRRDEASHVTAGDLVELLNARVRVPRRSPTRAAGSFADHELQTGA